VLTEVDGDDIDVDSVVAAVETTKTTMVIIPCTRLLFEEEEDH